MSFRGSQPWLHGRIIRGPFNTPDTQTTVQTIRSKYLGANPDRSIFRALQVTPMCSQGCQPLRQTLPTLAFPGVTPSHSPLFAPPL